MPQFQIGQRSVGDGYPVYFIADIAANHDGQLARAKRLIRLAQAAGADAAKFQHFRAPHIVSDVGFKALGAQQSHQASWRRSVYEVYEDASLPWEWTAELKAECEAVGIEFFSAPYDAEAVEMLDPYVSVFKIGSGDITWVEMVRTIASRRKPVILATGASDIGDVQRAVGAILEVNPRLALLQCNTNYTGRSDNVDHLHLQVLETYRTMFPEVVLGLSDHTAGHASVLGAVALGARVIEKHFTDDTSREGPDHGFSMTPDAWRAMVDRTRELERALGRPDKVVAANEQETMVLQRRCLRAARDLAEGTRLTREAIEVLRPAPGDAIPPYRIGEVVSRRLRRAMRRGEHFTWSALE